MIKLGLVGIGKIARDQHLPAIVATDGITLVAAASRHARIDGVDHYLHIDELLAAGRVDAVALCTPPQGRYEQARAALQAGRHVFLEKPPGATLSEVDDLAALARAQGLTLFASWHSRYAPGVEAARAWLQRKPIRSVRIDWREDVRHWHPGQDWIFAAGGLGVFDPGINALSIVTHVLPRAFFLQQATLDFPANRQAPIAAELTFADSAGIDIRASFDFLQTGTQTWDIEIVTDAGTLRLAGGGAAMFVDGTAQPLPPEAEYRGLYARFVQLIREGGERRRPASAAPCRRRLPARRAAYGGGLRLVARAAMRY
nr:Gfo/Idh/MocA family oxidoreductase [Solimonas soli]